MIVKEQFQVFEKSVRKVVQVLIENDEYSYREIINKSLEILRDDITNIDAIDSILELCEHPRLLSDIDFKTIEYEDWDKILRDVSNNARSLNVKAGNYELKRSKLLISELRKIIVEEMKNHDSISFVDLVGRIGGVGTINVFVQAIKNLEGLEISKDSDGVLHVSREVESKKLSIKITQKDMTKVNNLYFKKLECQW